SCNPVSWVAPVFSDNCSFSVTSNFQPGATLPLGTNTITYTATDAGGNTATCSFVVTVVDYTISFNKTNVSCNGGNNGSATAIATGTSGAVTYLWNTGAITQTINNLTAGNYTVTVTNGTCSRQASVSITQPAIFTASITPGGATTFCQGGNVTLTATAGASYQWNTGATTQSISVSTSGSYTVTVTNAAGCVATSAPVAVTVNPNVTATVSISANPSGPVSATTSITFTATPVNGGSAPIYQWKKNGVNVGTNSSAYTNSSWVNNDVVQCVMTSNATCAIGSPATSNSITISVTISAGAPKFVVSDLSSNTANYYDSSFVFISSSPLSTTVLNGNTNAADVFVSGGFGYIADGVTLGRIYRSAQAGVPSVASRNLRSNTGAALNQATGVYTIGDTLYLLDKKGKAIYSYTLSQSFTGTTNLNAFAKKSLANQNITAEAMGYDGTNFFVLENGNTKAIYRYPIGSTGTIVRSRPLQTPAGVALTDILGLVADGSRVWVTDNGTDMVYAFNKAALFTGSNTIPLNAISQFSLNSGNLNASGIALTTTTSLLRNNLNEVIDASLMAWPNPTSGNINIRLDGFNEKEAIRLSVFDLKGRLVLNQEVAPSTSSIATLDLTSIKSGLYAIVAEQGDLRRAVRIVVD
ncbi:MAG: T9SS type A sorting domain-containing protein, partial [Bacteroidota bacterium]